MLRLLAWEQVWAAWGRPAHHASQDEVEACQQTREESRAATSASLLHALDLHSRRAVAAVLAATPRVRLQPHRVDTYCSRTGTAFNRQAHAFCLSALATTRKNANAVVAQQ
jgi:hypothetical protein